MAINLVTDLLKYDDDEIIEYLEGVMGAVVKNYKTTIESKQPEVMWASFGDVSLVYSALKAIKKRNQLRKAQSS